MLTSSQVLLGSVSGECSRGWERFESGIPFPFFSNSLYNLTPTNNFLYRSQVQLYLANLYCSTALQRSSIHYVYCLFIQNCSVGSRWDQEGPGGPFLWFDIPSKISSQCEDYFMPYWDIAQIAGAVLRVSDCAGLYSVVYHSPHLPPHHFQECQNQPPVTKPVIIVQK